MTSYKRNIVCIEGRWVKDLTKLNSVAAGLDLLQKNEVIRKQRCLPSRSAQDTLELLTEFTQKRYNSFSLIYLSFHGAPGKIGLDKESLTLDTIGERLAGKLQGKALHFGSCSTLQVDKRYLTRFLTITEADIVSGFTEEIQFMESTLFDLLFFEKCQYHTTVVEAAKAMQSDYAFLCKKLGFRFVARLK